MTEGVLAPLNARRALRGVARSVGGITPSASLSLGTSLSEGGIPRSLAPKTTYLAGTHPFSRAKLAFAFSYPRLEAFSYHVIASATLMGTP